MGTLHERMQADIHIRRYSPRTEKEYLRCCFNFTKHFMRSPAQMGAEEVRTFLVHLVEVEKVSASVQKMYVAGLKFLYRITLNRPEVVERIAWPKIPKTLPEVLSPEEVARVLGAIDSYPYRMVLTTTYAAGLRISEACGLCVEDIDPARNVLHVRCGKGAKDRHVMLSPLLLGRLRDYWRAERPRGPLLFPGRNASRPVHPATVRNALHRAVAACSVTKHVSPHTLRHSFATHLMEAATPLPVIQAVARSRFPPHDISLHPREHAANRHHTQSSGPPPVAGGSRRCRALVGGGDARPPCRHPRRCTARCAPPIRACRHRA